MRAVVNFCFSTLSRNVLLAKLAYLFTNLETHDMSSTRARDGCCSTINAWDAVVAWQQLALPGN